MTPLNTDKAVQAATILQRSVCLTLTCSYLGNNRKVDLDELVGKKEGEAAEGDATVDESVFHATKRLLDPAVLRPCMRVVSKAKALLRGRAIPAHRVFGESSYLIPLMEAERTDQDLEAISDELQQEAARLAVDYEAAKEAQRIKLGKHWKASDYMTPAEVARSFGIDWHFVSFESPDRLESVSMALARKSNERHEARLADMYGEVVLQLRQGAVQVLRALVDKLGEGGKGKPKTLRGTALDDVLDFLNRLPSLNSIAGDDELVAAVAQVQAVVNGVDVEQLRDSQALRAQVQKVVAEAADAIDALAVETRSSRAISLGSLT